MKYIKNIIIKLVFPCPPCYHIGIYMMKLICIAWESLSIHSIFLSQKKKKKYTLFSFTIKIIMRPLHLINYHTIQPQ